MEEIAISKFKATCLGVIEKVRRTHTPIRITRFGRPIAEIIPPGEKRPQSWLGCMNAVMDVAEDIDGPVGAFKAWSTGRRETVA